MDETCHKCGKYITVGWHGTQPPIMCNCGEVGWNYPITETRCEHCYCKDELDHKKCCNCGNKQKR